MENKLRDIKKRVAKDWLDAFPQLVKYKQGKFYKIVGPLLIGVELIKLPKVEEYRPYFVAYSLWGNKDGKDLKSCLSSPLILQELFNSKGAQFSISYLNHDYEFSTNLNAIKSQTPILLDDKVMFKSLLLLFDEYAKTPPLDAAPNSFLQASLLERKLELSICAGDDKQVNVIFDEIKNRNWDLDHFRLWGVNYDSWLAGIESKISDKKQVLMQLETNLNDKSLRNLFQIR